ncbi:MAG: formate dehydrogenase accessory protein FdhE [Planctomycetota bacterium]
MSDINTEMQQFTEQIEALSKKKPECAKLLSFQNDTLLCQQKAKTDLCIEDFKFYSAELSRILSSGEAILKKLAPPLNIKIAESLFSELKEVAKKQSENINKQVTLIEKAVSSGKTDTQKLMSAAFSSSSAQEIREEAQKENLDGELLSLLILCSIKPNIEKYAESILPKTDLSSWHKPECPVCGFLPSISELQGEEGKRILFCSMCRATWRYPRIKCIFCGTEDQQALRILFPENTNAAYRADICDKCKKYLKTVDSRKADKRYFMELEDLATIDIDLLAEREGYTRGS